MNPTIPDPYPNHPVSGGRGTPLWFGIAIGLLAGALVVGWMRGGLGGGSAAEPRSVTARGDLAEDEKSVIELFQQASPSVVYITSLAHRRTLFGLNVLEIPQGTGSGFIWDAAGHIVTNFHVIKDANAVEVTLADHSSWKATLVGAEPGKDLAVLRISAPPRKLTPIAIGTSKDLRVGQKVFAIGNPFGLDHTLTTGVVSALGRTIPAFNARTIEGVVQTDAAINPGNSGGPLLDSAGRLIGVNTQLASPSGASVGVGFAVPVDTVSRVVPQLIAHGRVIRPYLGLIAFEENITQDLRRAGIVKEDGVVIRTIKEGGAAQEAGLRGTRVAAGRSILLGDVITHIDGHRVRSFDELVKTLERLKVGDTVTVTFLRNGETRSADVTLHAPP